VRGKTGDRIGLQEDGAEGEQVAALKYVFSEATVFVIIYNFESSCMGFSWEKEGKGLLEVASIPLPVLVLVLVPVLRCVEEVLALRKRRRHFSTVPK